jgi:hypothetical protein
LSAKGSDPVGDRAQIVAYLCSGLAAVLLVAAFAGFIPTDTAHEWRSASSGVPSPTLMEISAGGGPVAAGVVRALPPPRAERSKISSRWMRTPRNPRTHACPGCADAHTVADDGADAGSRASG